MTLRDGLAAHEDRLLACVHCGFCLPACPTYTRLGDEADSPRGRLVLMRAVVEGRLSPEHEAFQTHIDRCLGCRACETACPSGVEYGHLLERARHEAARAAPKPLASSLTLELFRRPVLFGLVMLLARVARRTGLPRWAARVLPETLGRLRLAAGMLAATAPADLDSLCPPSSAPVSGVQSTVPPAVSAGRASAAVPEAPGPTHRPDRHPTAALVVGCVQRGLFDHVNRATRRVLEANGIRVLDAPKQVCCGALHAHAGALDDARAMARRNIDAFDASGASNVVVNAAGCGATMKDYPDLFDVTDPDRERAAAFAGRVLDASQLLGSTQLRAGASMDLCAAYDAPCHLLHGQGIDAQVHTVLATIPNLRVQPLSTSTECCGGAGTYGLLHPDLGAVIGDDKVDDVAASGAELVVTGNPGCIMQIGAGMLRHGLSLPVVHPIQLLDESYRRAGAYDRP